MKKYIYCNINQFLDTILLTGHDARAPYTRHVDKPRGQKSDHATKSRKMSVIEVSPDSGKCVNHRVTRRPRPLTRLP